MVGVAVTVAIPPRLIINSNPAASTRRRGLSLVDAAEVVGHHQWLKVVAAWRGLRKWSLEHGRGKGDIAVSGQYNAMSYWQHPAHIGNIANMTAHIGNVNLTCHD